MNKSKSKTSFSFSPEKLAITNKLTDRYPKGKEKSALLPILHMAQEEHQGWLSAEVLDYVATLVGIEPIEVYEVATFYTMFNLKPVGKYVFEVCQTGPCMLKGSNRIIEYLQEKLDIHIGETTPDGLFTLKTVECLGACGYAPMLQLKDKYVEFLTETKIDELIRLCKENLPIPVNRS